MFWGEQFVISPLVQNFHFKADGDQPAVCTIGSKGWRSLKVEGWKADQIATVAKALEVSSVSTGWTSIQEIIRDWCKLAGGPWERLNHQDSIRFHRAILAEPEDMGFFINAGANQSGAAYYFESQSTSSQDPQDNVSEMTSRRLRELINLWVGRRFFLTSGGHFGLGPAKAEVGDPIRVLLGCRVPVVLHPRVALSFKRLGEVDFYSFVGQAHVESLIYYEGDLQQDRKDNEIKVEEFELQ